MFFVILRDTLSVSCLFAIAKYKVAKWVRLVTLHVFAYEALPRTVLANLSPPSQQCKDYIIQFDFFRHLSFCWDGPTFSWFSHWALLSHSSPFHILPFHHFPPTKLPPTLINSPPTSHNPYIPPPSQILSPISSTRAFPPPSPPCPWHPPTFPARGFTPTGWVDHLVHNMTIRWL